MLGDLEGLLQAKRILEPRESFRNESKQLRLDQVSGFLVFPGCGLRLTTRLTLNPKS